MNNGQIQIRKLDSMENAKVCARMMADSEPWISLQRTFDESLRIIIETTREVYIATINEEIVGVIIIEMLGTVKGYIKSVCVSSQHRGQGIGSILMKHVEKRIFSETPNVFLLVSDFNEGARKLYERLGYLEVGELKDFIVRGHSEILMRKTLAPLTEYKSE